MKQHFAGKRHAADDLQHAVADRLNRMAAERYDVGISKLASRYDICLSVESDYVEMLVKVCATTCVFVFFSIFNTYFVIAKRTLLSGYPSHKVRPKCSVNGTRKQKKMIQIINSIGL
jgi:hypothetical protein